MSLKEKGEIVGEVRKMAEAKELEKAINRSFKPSKNNGRRTWTRCKTCT